MRARARTRDPGGAGRLSRRTRRQLPDRLDRGRHGRGRLGRLEGAHRGSATAASWSATISSSPTPSASRGHRAWHRQLDPRQAQPDRHADRDLEAYRWRSATATRGRCRHRSGETEDSTIADLAVATNCGQIKTGSLSPLGPARRNTTSCSASRKSSARRPLRRALGPSRLTQNPRSVRRAFSLRLSISGHEGRHLRIARSGMYARPASRPLRRLILPALTAAYLGYFGFHALNGSYGLLARAQLEARLRTSKSSLPNSRAEHERWRRGRRCCGRKPRPRHGRRTGQAQPQLRSPRTSRAHPLATPRRQSGAGRPPPIPLRLALLSRSA